MITFDELKSGARIQGLCEPGPAQIVALERIDDDAANVVYKDTEGRLGEKLIYTADLANLTAAAVESTWSFDGNGDNLRLALEAERIRLAHLFDPYIALSNSSVEPLPHQIAAVYQEMLPRLPLRYVLADDPGAGKTIMTGLFIKELMMRGALNRCLIVAPGSLAEQWRDELSEKFNLQFSLLSSDALSVAASGNPFEDAPFLIARLDMLSRNERLQEMLKASSWDLVVCDEAHKMSASKIGRKLSKTKRFELGQTLRDVTEHFLLLTATPHNGKEIDFQLFMTLIDPDRFDVADLRSVEPSDVSDVMRRLSKEELRRFDGSPLFPDRFVDTVQYALSPAEADLYQAVTEYVQEEFNRSERLSKDKRNVIGFALMLLQRRLASSPEAIYRSLQRRRERLERRLAQHQLGMEPEEGETIWKDYDEDESPDSEMEAKAELILDAASAAATTAELQAEIDTLSRLETQADAVRRSGEDRKWQELSALLENNPLFSRNGQHREKLIIFTEHRDTISYLHDRISQLLGSDSAVVEIHGGMKREDRKHIETEFRNNPDVQILLATDAAGEGINLQMAHLMINYDLPWNPNRIEQRFGRIHRIGQQHTCHLWNLVSVQTREGKVFERLFSKLEQERASLPGKVFDVLGKVVWENNKSLRDLLIEAVRSEDAGDVERRVLPDLDAALDPEKLAELMKEHALAEDMLTDQTILEVREEMERAQAQRLQPFYLRFFFLEAVRALGGRIDARGKDRWEIKRVPQVLKADRSWTKIASKYERICFDRSAVYREGEPDAELITPGHPLLNALTAAVLRQYQPALRNGAVLIDDNMQSDQIRVLVVMEDTLTSEAQDSTGNPRVVSSELTFVELLEDGTARNAGIAPYLDCRMAAPDEEEQVQRIMSEADWLRRDATDRAQKYIISRVVPRHLARVRERTLGRVQKVSSAVQQRLKEEIKQVQLELAKYTSTTRARKKNDPVQTARLRQRFTDLSGRLAQRMSELEQEKHISSTSRRILTGAVIIPGSMLHGIGDTQDTFSDDAMARSAVERAAVEAVMEAERSMGYEPRDVSSENRGYDIESAVPEALLETGEPVLRFIEVKGRAYGARTVTLTRNEIMTACNEPEQYILALVDVDKDKTHTTYLKYAFREVPEFDITSVNYDIGKLISRSEIVFEYAPNAE